MSLTLCLYFSHSWYLSLSVSYPCVSLSLSLTLYLPVSLSLSLFISHSRCLSISLFLTLFTSHYINLSLSLSLTLYISHSLYLSLSISLTLYISHSFYLSLVLSLTLVTLTLYIFHCIGIGRWVCISLWCRYPSSQAGSHPIVPGGWRWGWRGRGWMAHSYQRYLEVSFKSVCLSFLVDDGHCHSTLGWKHIWQWGMDDEWTSISDI